MTHLEVIKILKKSGWTFVEGAKHTKGIGPNGQITWIARHKKDIPIGTLREIEKQTGIKLK